MVFLQQIIKFSLNKMSNEKKDFEFVVQIVAIVVLVGLLMYGLGKSSSINGGAIGTGMGTVSASEVIPSGVPEIYGQELQVSYDDISPSNQRLADATIAKLSQYEGTALNDGQMERYIRIGSSISCEYCCGAASIIFSNGDRACGCAHSYAMRGLAKYLLINHPKMSDEEILEELGKWKVLFFPEIHQGKAAVLKSQGIELNYINLASNKYRGIEQGQTSGGMVGGC